VKEQQAQRTQEASWRVRAWIRVAAVLVVALLSWEQSDVVRRVGRGEMPGREVRDGYLFLAALALSLFLLTFRPLLRMDPNGMVYVRNPIGSRRFRAAEVVDVSVNQWGLAIRLSSGRIVRSIIFQDTGRAGEPRWFDVAEALTGVRPAPPALDEDD